MVRLKVILTNQRRLLLLLCSDYDCGTVRLQEISSGNPQSGVTRCYGEGTAAKQ
jgi:hypothetical protein